MSKTNSKKRGVVSVCLAALLSASAWHVADVEARDDERSQQNLRVIGLTDDGRLVSFKAQSPRRQGTSDP